ncbi:hypothetical protein G3576_28880 [Roseomonas stagni]|uniref:Uncharacterized protein n=1 Tax=Falsiroseomonas algicola TaxID=2716930 RepID=A0A6M1LU94_9PROT|nr:hypothetical protein [Falsiroseomonas algicola]NGM24055.1 hypothetical protein [Falsiroseomonas algicola]
MADQRTDTPAVQGAEAPVSLATQRRGRADPFAHGALPMRPNYLPEEEEEGGGNRSELWSVAKALLIAAGVILVMGWLLARSA